jgi:hypothetical protein
VQPQPVDDVEAILFVTRSQPLDLIYCKLPDDIMHRHVLLLDPILPGGYSAVRAIEALLVCPVPVPHFSYYVFLCFTFRTIFLLFEVHTLQHTDMETMTRPCIFSCVGCAAVRAIEALLLCPFPCAPSFVLTQFVSKIST